MVDFGPFFVFGLVLLCLEVALLYACMMGMRRISVKLGASKGDAHRTLDRVLQRIWVAPMWVALLAVLLAFESRFNIGGGGGVEMSYKCLTAVGASYRTQPPGIMLWNSLYYVKLYLDSLFETVPIWLPFRYLKKESPLPPPLRMKDLCSYILQ